MRIASEVHYMREHLRVALGRGRTLDVQPVQQTGVLQVCAGWLLIFSHTSAWAVPFTSDTRHHLSNAA